MPTTSNFGWTTPADTDLVKDGAAAIRTLGNGIDSSLVDLKGGTTGQYLVKQSATDLDFTWTTNTADIDGVTATSPLTGGGTSGTITVGIQDATTAQKGAVQLTDSISSTSTTTAATPNSVKTAYDLANGAIAKSLVDAKADLITATADNTPARLASSAVNGDVLTVDTSTATGLKWAAPTTSTGYKLIKRSTFTSVATTTTTFDDVFTSTYKNYLIIVENIGSATAGSSLYFQWRYAGPTTQAATYYGGNIAGSTTGSASAGGASSNSSQLIFCNQTGTSATRGQMHVQGVGNASENPTLNYQITDIYGGLTSNGGGWNNTARTYTGFILSASAGNITGTVAIYGLAI